MSQADRIYRETLEKVLEQGRKRGDRTGTGTKSVFGLKSEPYNLLKGKFPILTGKKVNFNSVWSELLWFLKGDTNTAFLHEHNNHIWDEWANEKGDLGPVYGKMWRSWPDVSGGEIDQIKELIKGLRENPFSRRHIVSGWNPAFLPIEGADHKENVNSGRQALPPCHTLFQFYVVELTNQERNWFAIGQSLINPGEPLACDGELDLMNIPKLGLSCQLYQRSADMFLGVPFNIASYALLTCIIAEMTGMAPLEFHHSFGDAHVYLNHMGPVAEYMNAETHPAPQLFINPKVRHYASIDELRFEDVRLVNYTHGKYIKAEIAV